MLWYATHLLLDLCRWEGCKFHGPSGLQQVEAGPCHAAPRCGVALVESELAQTVTTATVAAFQECERRNSREPQ